MRPLDPLPIDAVLPALVSALRQGAAAVLSAPPGAGKTTRVPPALLAAGLLGPGRLVMLEPRRLAARAAARRMAAEQGWRVGEEVGYQVRFERQAGAATRILVVTEGILVQMLQADPFLAGIGALIFDELHERSLATDLSLAMARRVQREARPDLRLLAMSATLDTAAVAAFLGGCPVVESRGRAHEVEVRYLDPGAQRTTGSAAPPPLPLLAAAAVRRALAESAGDLLVFLPGIGEIQRTAAALAALAAEQDLAVVPLYGDLPAERQDAALRPASRRKVVLATNVAETSVTVEGVGAVIDSGLARRLRYDPASGLDRLELARISRASADQRAGRAGRQGRGLCLRLWGSWEQAARAEREVPEIARVDLAAPALQLLSWGESDLAAFGWFEAPDPAALAAALRLLRRLGAVGGQGVTADGRIMARLPVHPRLARLLLVGHRRGHPRDAALLAALLAERDPFPRGSGAPEGGAGHTPHTSRSDLLDRLEELERFSRSDGPRREERGGADGGAGHRRGEDGEADRGLVGRRGGSNEEDRGGERRRDGGEADRRGAQVTGAELGRLQPGAAHFVLRARDQLARLARRELGAAPTPGGREDALLQALFLAYPDRLARRRAAGGPRAVMVGGRGVRLAETSAVREAPLFVAVEVDAGRGRSGPEAEDRVRLASAVELAWLDAERLTTSDEIAFDEQRERVAVWRRTRWEDLVVAESEVPLATGGGGPTGHADPDGLASHAILDGAAGHAVPGAPTGHAVLGSPTVDAVPGGSNGDAAPAGPADDVPRGPASLAAAAEAVLVEAAAGRPQRALPLDDPEVVAWLARVRCLAEWMPELELPDFGGGGGGGGGAGVNKETSAGGAGETSDGGSGGGGDDGGGERGGGLAAALRQLLPVLAAGRRSFAELRRAPLLPALQGLLTRRQLAALAREAPERLAVPSGSQIRLRYEPGRPPVLAARIQELFGLAETPRVAQGRIPVLLHLLAPNQRPQQVTQDLRSFWQKTYPQVKKELQGRYPKHSWPDDPWNAAPERRPRRPARGSGGRSD